MTFIVILLARQSIKGNYNVDALPLGRLKRTYKTASSIRIPKAHAYRQFCDKILYFHCQHFDLKNFICTRVHMYVCEFVNSVTPSLTSGAVNPKLLISTFDTCDKRPYRRGEQSKDNSLMGIRVCIIVCCCCCCYLCADNCHCSCCTLHCCRSAQ